jgi:acetyl esterase/lipase
MEMNMKRLTRLVLILLMTGALTACGSAATALTPTTAAVVTQRLPTPETYPTAAVIPLPAPLQINEKTDLPYNSYELLDVFSPVSAGSWPVVIVLHGGDVTKASVSDLARAIAGLGAVVFAPSYDTSTGPADAFEDVACAVRFGRAHASQYGGKDDRVIVVGHSLGGLAGALMMFAGDEFKGDCLTRHGSAFPDAEVSLDGGFDPIPFAPPEVCKSEPDVCLKIDPFTYISRKPIRNGVRFVLLVGEYPSPQKNTQAFRDALQEAGYEASLAQIPGLNHNEMRFPGPETLSSIMSVLQPPAP